MRKVSVFNFITLNGYFHGPDGDISWNRHEEEEADLSDKKSQQGNTLLFGRVTYQHMASFWPTPTAKQKQPVTADGMNKAEKIVFSRTLKSADWENTRLIKEDLTGTVRRLKQEPGSDITILGSGTIVTQLADAGLIDGYSFMINPVALGEGVPVFRGMKNRLNLKLTSSKVFRTGVIMVTYEPVKL